MHRHSWKDLESILAAPRRTRAIRTGSLVALVALSVSVLAIEQDPAPTALWSEKVSRGLAAAPFLIGNTVWMPRPKGGVEIRSLADGERLVRLGGKSDMRLLDGASDTLVFAKERSGFRVVFVTRDPPAIVAEISLREPILDIDSNGGITAFIRAGSEVGLVDDHGVTRLGRIRLPGPGWCRLDLIRDRDHGVLLFLSKRDGMTVAATTDGILADLGELTGGVLEVFPYDGGALVCSAEGIIRRLGPDFSSVWDVHLGTGLHAHPFLFAGDIWLALRDRRVVRLDPEDGSIRSVFRAPSQVKCALFSTGNQVLWCDVKGGVMAVDTTGRKPVWRFEPDRPAVGVAAGEDRLVVATEEGRLHCFDLQSLPSPAGTQIDLEGNKENMSPNPRDSIGGRSSATSGSNG